MLKTFQKYAAATALSLPLLIPGVVNAQAMAMPGTAPLGNQPVSCEQSQKLGALNDCLSMVLPISDSVQSILAREAGWARQSFEDALAHRTRASAQNLRNTLATFDQANIAACQASQNSVARFNAEWQAAIDANPVDFDIDDTAKELPYIDTTPGLRQATRDYISHSAECLATGVDTLKFMMEQSGSSALQVQGTVNPLYRGIHSYARFNTN